MKKTDNTPKNNLQKTPVSKGNPQKDKAKKANEVKPLFVAIAAALAILTFALMQKLIPDSEILQQQDVSKGNFFFLSLISSLVAFVGVLFNTQNWAKNVTKYSTLAFIVFHILLPLLLTCQYLKPEVDKYTYLSLYLTITIIPIIVLGAVALYQERENFANTILSAHKEPETTKEEKKSIVSSCLRWCKTEGWFQLAIFFLIVLTAGTIYFYRLSSFDTYDDEYQITNVAEGYMNNGKFNGWWDYFEKKGSGVTAEENHFHIWLIAQCYKVLGVNEFATRLPSAIFGIIYMFIAYLVARYFTKDKFISILVVLAFMLDTEMIHFFRYARTYSVFIPFFVLFFYVFYRAVAEEKTYLGNSNLIKFVNVNFNFNHLFLLFAVILIPILWSMKTTSAVLLPSVFLLILMLAVFERKKRYLIASLMGIIACFIAYFGLSDYLNLGYFSFFNSPMSEQNKVYLSILTQYPVSKDFFIAMAGLGLVMLFLSKSPVFRRKLIYFYSTLLTVAVFFVYIINYQGIGSRYVYHAVPIATLFLVFVLFTFLKPIFNKIVAFAIAGLLILSSLNTYSNKFEGIYLKNAGGYGQTQKAYNILLKNIKPDDIIFSRYFRDYHFRTYGKRPLVKEMAKENTQFQKNTYGIDDFLTDLKTHKRGWAIWQTFMYGEISAEVSQYINLYFKKMSGMGIDDSKTELFYFDESMIVDKATFEQDKNFPVANMDLSKPYSVAFWMNANVPNSPAPIILGKDPVKGIAIESNNAGGYKFIYTPNSQELATGNLPIQQWHHIVWSQEGGAKGKKYSLYVDGKLKESKTLTQDKLEQVKFFINRYYNGKLQDIRIYDSELTQAQIDVIFNSGTFNLEGTLTVDGKKYEPFGHWTIK